MGTSAYVKIYHRPRAAPKDDEATQQDAERQLKSKIYVRFDGKSHSLFPSLEYNESKFCITGYSEDTGLDLAELLVHLQEHNGGSEKQLPKGHSGLSDGAQADDQGIFPIYLDADIWSVDWYYHRLY